MGVTQNVIDQEKFSRCQSNQGRSKKELEWWRQNGEGTLGTLKSFERSLNIHNIMALQCQKIKKQSNLKSYVEELKVFDVFRKYEFGLTKWIISNIGSQ